MLIAAAPRAPAAACTLILSEYVEGTGNNKAVEIYNPGPNSISLSSAGSNYVVQVYANGTNNPNSSISLTGTVAAGATYVLAHNSATSTLLAVANQTSGSLTHNGNDALVLRAGGASGQVVDHIGQVGFNPGTAWSNSNVSTLDQTLRRKAAVTVGDTNTTAAFNPSLEWVGLAVNTFAGLGSHSNDCGSGPTGTPPVLQPISNRSVRLATLLQFSISATPTDGDTVWLSVSNAPAGAVLAATNENGTFTWSVPNPTGTYAVTFYATDKDGADSETIAITVLPVNTTFTNIWDFEDGWQNWTNYSRFSNKNWTWTNTNGAEGTDWKMEIYGYLADASSDDWLISPALNLSAVTEPAIRYWTYRVESGNDIQVLISTNYPGSGDPLAAGISWNTLTLNRPGSQNLWTATTNDLSAYVGADSVRIAFYYTGKRTRAARWSVDQVRYTATESATTNAPPFLSSIGDYYLVVSNNLQIAVHAVDPIDNDPITLAVSNAPSGAEFSSTNGNGTFIWLAAAPIGVYTTSFYAVDKDGVDSETISIHIEAPPGPTNLPVLAAIGDKSVVVGHTLSFAVSASDADGDAISLVASNVPAGAHFSSDNETGLFAWTNAAPVGTYTTLFYAVDNDGADSETVRITVSPVSQYPPVLAAVGDLAGNVGAGLVVNLSAEDPDGDAITMAASNLPGGAVFVDLGNGAANFTWAHPPAVGVFTSSFFAVTQDGSDSEPVVITIAEAVNETEARLTLMAANLSSGTSQAYEEPGIRIFQGLKPDVACLQEFNYGGGIRSLVDTAFGTNYSYYVETDGEQIPNGVVSRYPMLSSGQWVDPNVANRDFAWAIIDIPGTQNLYVVSVHFLTAGSTERNTQATLLRGLIQTNWPGAALVAVCGDLNTVDRSESALTTLSTVVSDTIKPKDQNGDMDTNAGRNNDYDYVLTSATLNSKHTNTVIGGLTFASGMVFDSRLWASPPEPVLSTDSGASGMQHMGVMKTFVIGQAGTAATQATLYAISGRYGSISPTNSRVNFHQNQAFTISPAAQCAIANVFVDGVSIGITNAYTFANVTNNHSIAATFTSNTMVLLTIDRGTGPHSGAVTTSVAVGSQQVCSNANALSTSGATQYVLSGWARTGSAPASGSGNNTGAFTMTTNTTVTWLWFTNYWFNSEAGPGGAVTVTDRWAALGSDFVITALPADYYDFTVWSGDVEPAQVSNASVTVVIDRPLNVTANFAARLATHDVPQWWLASYGWTSDFDAAALDDQDGDGMPTWMEHVALTVPTNKQSVLRIVTNPGRTAGQEAVLSWLSATGRLYDVDIRSNLVNDGWAPYASGLAAHPPQNVFTGAVGSGRVLFRIRVRQ